MAEMQKISKCSQKGVELTKISGTKNTKRIQSGEFPLISMKLK